MNNVLVVFNFSAGRKKAVKFKKQIIKFLLKRCARFKFISIELLKTAEFDNFDTILAVGGDGTINKVLKYIINTDKILGIIPSGTANLLAAKLGINNLKQALKIIDRQNYIKIDLMNINNKLSILRCGLGFDADIIGKTPQSLKNKFGYLSYFIAGIIFALRLKTKEYVITANREQRAVKASCIIAANAGNMYKNLFQVADNSKLNDGLFDIFILKTQNPALLLIEILKITLNIRKNNSIAEYIKTKDFKIKNKYCLAHIDGEKTKFTEDLNFELMENSINVYCA